MIVERFLSRNKFSRPGKIIYNVRGIVVHYVGVPDQHPEQTVAYFESLKYGRRDTYASAHYVIGKDGNGIQCLPLNEVAYHCGAKQYKNGITHRLGNYPNYTTIGIEMCHTAKGFTQETIDTTVNLVTQLLVENKLSYHDVYRHYDITGKLCPKFFVIDEKQWISFIDRIKENLC